MVLYLRTGLCAWTFAVRLTGQEELAEARSEVVGPGVVLSKSWESRCPSASMSECAMHYPAFVSGVVVLIGL